MTTAILVGGLLVTVLVAYLMRRPAWRLPSLLFALLAVPGNLDNLMPQMRLDPHAIANSTGPAVSFVDLLIAWGIILTFREGRFAGWSRELRWVAGFAIAVSALAAVVTAVNVFQGLDLPAALRGILVIARIPALLGLALGLRGVIGDGRHVAVAMALGLVGLLGNGLFTSGQLETTRFTAATFGRNGFALVLMSGALVSVGLAVDLLRRAPDRRGQAIAAGCFALAASGLFGAIATGTRISILVAVPAAIVALLVNRSWWHRRGAAGVSMIALGVLAIGLAATLWTAEGGRALSVFANPGDTVDIITDPEGEPDYSSARTRMYWWRQALAMIQAEPITGVGAYQWNIIRYETDPDANPIVADPHSTYVQIAAEFGLPMLAMYVLGLTALAVLVLLTAWRSSSPVRHSTIATAIVAAALMIPVTELTNSHLFNVRIGAVTWLLLGVALTLTVVPTLAARSEASSPPLRPT